MSFRRFFPSWLSALLLLGLAVLWPGQVALAHAVLVRADPSSRMALPTPPSRVILWFSEPLSQSLSSIYVLSANKQRVEVGPSRVAADSAKRIEVNLDPLAEGIYTVVWTTNSLVDGHTLKGTYLFAVAAGSPPPGFFRQGEAPGITRAVEIPGISWTSSQVADTATRWLVLISALLLVGGWLFQWAVPSLLLGVQRDDMWSREIGPLVERRWLYLEYALLLLLFLSVVGNTLSVEASAVGSWGKVFSPFMVSFLTSSRFGLVSLCKLGLASFLMLTPLLRREVDLLARGAEGHEGIQPEHNPQVGTQASWRAWRWEPFLLALGSIFLFLVALSGHAAAVSFPFYSSLLLDWLHLMAAASWLGGMGFIALVLLPASGGHLSTRWKSIVEVLPGFSPIALTSASVLAVTGLFSAEARLSSPSEIFSTLWGRFLLAKLVMFTLMVAISYIHAFILRPRVIEGLRRGTTSRASGLWLERLLRLEPAIGAMVIALTVLLASYPPPGLARAPVSPPGSEAQDAAPAFSPRFSLAERVNDLLVEIKVGPGTIGPNTFVVSVSRATDGSPLEGPILVRLRATFLDQEVGSQYLMTQTRPDGSYEGEGDLALEGRWRLEVIIRRPEEPDAVGVFEFPIPVQDGTALLAQAERKMNGLKALREHQALSGGGDETLVVGAEYQAPDMAYQQTQDGWELYIIGGTRYSGEPGGSWRVYTSSPGLPSFTWPDFNFKSLVQPVIIGSKVIQGQRQTIVAAYDPELKLRYLFWIGQDDQRVYRWEHIVPGHFVTITYSDFDSQAISIQAPITEEGP